MIRSCPVFDPIPRAPSASHDLSVSSPPHCSCEMTRSAARGSYSTGQGRGVSALGEELRGKTLGLRYPLDFDGNSVYGLLQLIQALFIDRTGQLAARRLFA